MRPFVAWIGWLLLQPVAFGADPSVIDFSRDIRPILSDNCFRCHGQDEAGRQADLRLDTVDGQRANQVVVPGSPESSQLLERILSDDPDRLMPPGDSNRTLTDYQKDQLRRWIAQGAVFQPHWSLRPVSSQPPPEVSANSALLRNPIDNFIVAALEEHGLTQSPEADRSTLLRRLSLDLTGLGPTREEATHFLADSSVDAYEKAVDRLLASPAFGEKMALPWLDAARYADTHGYQKDNHREMWPWRDWLIGAFNANMPFDQFTLEQLAGDLLPEATVSQQVASGFHRNHRINAEAGSIDEEFLAEYVADRVETTSTVWLGMTVGCARCHDHKFDPISQREYYQLYAFFNNIDEKGVDGVTAAPQPNLVVQRPEFVVKLGELSKRVADLKQQISLLAKSLVAERQAWEAEQKQRVRSIETGDGWMIVEPVNLSSAGKMNFAQLADGSFLVSGENPLNDVHSLEIRPPHLGIQAIRLEVLPHASHTKDGYARNFDGRFVLSGVDIELIRSDAPPEVLSDLHVRASSSRDGWSITAVMDHNSDSGWSTELLPAGSHPIAIFPLPRPVPAEERETIRIRLRYESKEEQAMIGRFRLSVAVNPETGFRATHELPQALLDALQASDSRRSSRQKELLDDLFARDVTHSELQSLQRQLTELDSQRQELESQATVTTMVMRERAERRPTFVHQRGLYNQLGEAVEPKVPACFPQLEGKAPFSRLDLARWLVAPNHPLTARVIVNRFWQMYFGQGLVRTAEDFGSQGDWPTHPELLDWLAFEFMRSGWDIKAIQRLIVTSATYRQSVLASTQSQENDPDNRWLSRGPRFRLPPHLLRDQALAASGLLVRQLGGPSVKPYQPLGLWESVAGINSNTQRYRQDSGASLYRRSLYTYWKRAVPPPSMMILDAVDREVCSVQQRATNTPLQALTTLNDPTFVEAGRVLAEASLLHIGDLPAADEQRIDWLFSRILVRLPDPIERSRCVDALDRYRAWFAVKQDAAAQLLAVGESARHGRFEPTEVAAWTMLASLLLNLDETLTKG
jgi:hypothetical protein